MIGRAEAQASFEPKILGLGKVPARWIFSLLGLAILTAGAATTILESRAAEAFMRDVILGEARMMAEAVDRERFSRLTGTIADESSADYLYLRDQIARARAANPRFTYIYLMGRNSKGLPFFYMGTAPKGSAEYSPPGQEYPEYAPTLAYALDTGIAKMSDPVTDRWGTWISALVPLRESGTGRMLAVFGMDIDASDWRNEIGRRTLAPAGLTLFAGIGLLALYLVLSNRQRARSERTAQLVLSEKLAAQGRIAAGIAHDLNTPLGAVNSAAAGIERGAQWAIFSLPAFLRGLDDDRSRLFEALVKKGTAQPLLDGGASARAEARKIRAVLEKAGIADPASLSYDLVAIGQDGSDTALLDEIRERGPGMVGAAVEMVDLARAQRIIRDGASRAAKSVLALRGLAGREPGENAAEIDLGKEIETVLSLYHYRFRSGVELKFEAEPEARILGNPDRLSQVWVNLIGNAIFAIGGSGRLEISVRRSGGGIECMFSNDGPSLSPEERERIFSPFFTTKAPGEGTGMGLHLSKLIVEEHGGSLSFESGPGRTSFIVALPSAPGKVADSLGGKDA